jgi:hypothetical protein
MRPASKLLFFSTLMLHLSRVTMSIPLTPQYDPKSLYTDGCTSAACQATLSAPNSLPQGRTFLEMNKTLHGGRRGRKSRSSRRKSHRRRSSTRKQRGGMADYPSQFSELLPTSMHRAADIGELDSAFAQLPSFVGKYGGVGGRRKTRGRKGHRGGGFGYTPGSPNAPNYMILSPAEEPKAFLNPQWYTENMVVPSFQGPVNAFAQQSYNNQFNYAQRAGSRRRHRKGRKASRKSRKGRKGSRKH